MTPKSLSVVFNQKAQRWVMSIRYEGGARVYVYDSDLNRLLKNAANYAFGVVVSMMLMIMPVLADEVETVQASATVANELVAYWQPHQDYMSVTEFDWQARRCCRLLRHGITTPVCETVLPEVHEPLCQIVERVVE